MSDQLLGYTAPDTQAVWLRSRVDSWTHQSVSFLEVGHTVIRLNPTLTQSLINALATTLAQAA